MVMHAGVLLVGTPALQLPAVFHEPPAAFVQLSHGAARAAPAKPSWASRTTDTTEASSAKRVRARPSMPTNGISGPICDPLCVDSATPVSTRLGRARSLPALWAQRRLDHTDYWEVNT